MFHNARWVKLFFLFHYLQLICLFLFLFFILFLSFFPCNSLWSLLLGLRLCLRIAVIKGNFNRRLFGSYRFGNMLLSKRKRLMFANLSFYRLFWLLLHILSILLCLFNLLLFLLFSRTFFSIVVCLFFSQLVVLIWRGSLFWDIFWDLILFLEIENFIKGFHKVVFLNFNGLLLLFFIFRKHVPSSFFCHFHRGNIFINKTGSLFLLKGKLDFRPIGRETKRIALFKFRV